jgi:hypothetical protein
MTCCEKTEKETIERCAKFVEGGRFLHDGAPTAIFGRECAAAMRRALLPAPQVEPEDLPHPGTGRLLHASPVFAPQVEKREECIRWKLAEAFTAQNLPPEYELALDLARQTQEKE